MNFTKALEALKAGLKIKLPHWKGYWVKEDDTVKMYCKNGDILDIRETEDVFYTLSNIASNEWEIAEDSNIDLAVKTFSFGEAIRLIKQGKKVARKGWNGKGMYIFEVIADGFWTNSNITDLEMPIINESIAMRTSDKSVCIGWLASQSDMFAEDWIIVE
ncbi:MAG: DUF2829 domain-containing protein [Acutalibacteraceae bacterium]|nr:DUF2829 domain-containing protein [Acutalibacteraceae bacterium]